MRVAGLMLINVAIVMTAWVRLSCRAQELPSAAEQQLEDLANAEEQEPVDDNYFQQFSHFTRHPLNLNTAEKEELQSLGLLTDLQIESLFAYRRLLGNLENIYEMQAIPAWNIGMIRRLLPFITLAGSVPVPKQFYQRFKKGDHTVLLRISQVKENSIDAGASGSKHLGSPQRLFFRYGYNFQNLLQYGIAGDKDAGEQFFKGSQKKGFDFYGFHFYMRKLGIIDALALGDFTINMGQGLIHWQGLAFKKSAGVMQVKRQSPVLRPYHSAGEFYFNRGVAITLRRRRVEATAFISLRKLSANLEKDSVGNKFIFSAFQTSGYHRNENELADKNALRQFSSGINARYRHGRFMAGINGIGHRFSASYHKRDDPYNLYAIKGDHWYNASFDYSYTYRNFHFFGEAATDKNFHRAILNGVLLSADPKLDIALVHRVMDKAYQALYGNAFTENSMPGNEKGIYAGVTIRPVASWRLDAYADIYEFPWLKYRMEAPSSGSDFFIQVSYTPNRRVEWYSRFKNELKNLTGFLSKQNWRTHLSYKISASITLRNRVEMVWYGKQRKNVGWQEQEENETGFLTYMDMLYKPLMQPFSATVRLQYFETDGYESRLYAYENDVLSGYSIPAFFEKGYRYYVLLSYKFNKQIACWLRWAATISGNKTQSNKTEWKLQVKWEF